MRTITAIVLLVVLVMTSSVLTVPAVAQTETATVSGRVTDPQGHAVPDAQIQLVNIDTNVGLTIKTNSDGLYVVPGIRPGPYRIVVVKDGFKEVVKTGLVLHVQDIAAENFSLQIGSVSESITVKADDFHLNTTDGSVGTVIDRKYVENTPLNGRSFQDLILLTPGVVPTPPGGNGSFDIGVVGEYSVNGQRTESNYFTVDGVSANAGANNGFITPQSSAGVSGSLPGSTALGTTHSLVSVDALEEFRVQSSTYSAEYGRNPGGQFSFVTRSGTNDWHGTAFDYFRNGVLDANDWFTNYFRHSQPALRQNDFGGTLGGPLKIPGIYEGKDKTFFFFSYEGLRLVQPQPAIPTPVPDALTRQTAASALQPLVNAFPLPNGPELGTFLAQFIGSWSNRSQIDAISIRVDHDLTSNLRLFFRFSDTPSSSEQRQSVVVSPSEIGATEINTRTYTLGATAILSNRVNNEFRLNYSSAENINRTRLDDFGGAKPADFNQLQGFNSPAAQAAFVLVDSGPFVTIGAPTGPTGGIQRQWNVVDTIGLAIGHHQLKLGADYRRLTPVATQTSPSAIYFYSIQPQVELQTNTADFALGSSTASAYPLYQNFSVFVQDEWKIKPRLNLSMGVRWDVNPAPGVTRGLMPYTVQGADPATLSLAPQGTPLWKTTWFNFAPRLGAAYVIHDSQARQTVVRGGGGLFFDTGQQAGSTGFIGPGFNAQSRVFGAAFPLPVAQVTPVIANPPVAPYSASAFAFPAHLQLPYTLQWNVSLEQALGKTQALTLSYVGSHASRLLEQNILQGGSLNPAFVSNGLSIFQSGASADYGSLQVEFQRRISKGLQALASYTWSHSIDYGSTNVNLPYRRGNSDFDLRHNFAGAMSYDLPAVRKGRLATSLFSRWALDGRFTARTGFPVTLNGQQFIDPTTGLTFNTGLNLVSGQSTYVYGSQCAAVYGNGLGCPGGWAINPNAFSLPSSGVGTAPRNFARGFGAWQMDLAIRREFPIHERLRLEFRAESFNIFNHPSFGAINATYCAVGPGSGCTFGQASSTLAQGGGILSPIYANGGPRSSQFALKLVF